MKYRSRTEIIDSMLRSIRSGATKTHIMYRAYMSYAQLKEYLALLQDKSLIVFDQKTQLYRLTEKGLKFMDAYDKIYELVPKVSEMNQAASQPISQPEVFEY